MESLKHLLSLFTAGLIIISSCGSPTEEKDEKTDADKCKEKIAQYEFVTLKANLEHLSESELDMLPIFIKAANVIDEIFWLQSYGEPKETLLSKIEDPYMREYAVLNYGPWGRLEGHTAFMEGYDDKPRGAAFYPHDMNRVEFDTWRDTLKNSPYTLIRRGEMDAPVVKHYARAYREQLEKISTYLHEAASIAEYSAFADYLRKLAADHFIGDFTVSEKAWMQMKNNNLDLVLRPLDTGEDRLFGLKKSYTAFVLAKDVEWTERLSRYNAMVPDLQRALPVPQEFREQMFGQESEIIAYNALYYAGQSNAGPKIIALHLPQYPAVQKITGTRSMQLKNVTEAKFINILKPIGKLVIHETQNEHISFDAFFQLVAFHEIAAGLNIARTIDENIPVREALREHHSVIEATATDLMALHLITELNNKGHITDEELAEAYITSFASILRSVRFGTAGAHGIAAMIRFNFFERENAFSRCNETNTFIVDIDKMKAAIEKGVEKFLTIQAKGNIEKAEEIIERDAQIPEILAIDIEKINAKNIPVDVAFHQGMEYLKVKDE